MEKLKQYILNFNLFPSIPPSTDPYQLKNETISTKIFIILFILIMTILLLYTSLATITKTVNVQSPTIEKYFELYSKYSQTLSCPCTKISIDYGNILDIEYSLHQICQSDFISGEWIYSLDYVHFQGNSLIWYRDLLSIFPLFFQGLQLFCTTIEVIIHDSLKKFNSNQYVSTFLTPSEFFESQILLSINQFQTSLINDYALSLSMVQEMMESNSLYVTSEFNYELYKSNKTFYAVTSLYNNCTCDLVSSCIYTPTYNNTEFNITEADKLPGFYIGCYSSKGLLSSNLQFLYYKSYIERIRSIYRWVEEVEVSRLEKSISNIYSENSSVQELINKIMIDQWNSLIMYEKYYNECYPKLCTYSYQTRNDFIYIITTLVGLIGGVITTLKFIVPRIVKLFRRYVLKHTKIHSQTPTIQN
ncbi:unnamed protein product [Adineta ricciae]|uniref:Uncharacterized protein n=1 Tax=Adineta ricciae TaxID=249248 RepID=A0A815VL47_ADIRI|nr:unnamed protein product [Adineta ricciae]CAF1561178.1 unnamed protein product [Adineta ricciae]